VADVVSRHGHVTISVGGVTFLTVEQDVDQMVRRADAEMYRAKAAGKNRVHHAVEAGTGAAERAVP
jgi:PleD family two-component response regulator